jgi:hypothetical protein
MDPIELATTLTPFLAPLLPHLLKASDSAADEAGKRMAGAAWDGAKALWTKITEHGALKNATIAAATESASSPTDPDLMAALRLHLRGTLEADSALAREAEDLWRKIEPSSATVIAAGVRSIAVGRSVHGSTLITGDQNIMKP